MSAAAAVLYEEPAEIGSSSQIYNYSVPDSSVPQACSLSPAEGES
jgi:hypothetical protein